MILLRKPSFSFQQQTDKATREFMMRIVEVSQRESNKIWGIGKKIGDKAQNKVVPGLAKVDEKPQI